MKLWSALNFTKKYKKTKKPKKFWALRFLDFLNNLGFFEAIFQTWIESMCCDMKTGILEGDARIPLIMTSLEW